MHSIPPGTLDYAGDRTPPAGPPRWDLRRRFVLASLLLVLTVVLLVVVHPQSIGGFYLGQGWERLAGTLWIVSAVVGLACLITFPFCRKRWDVWVGLTLHGITVALTVFPGCFVIPFLMHWMTGPGA